MLYMGVYSILLYFCKEECIIYNSCAEITVVIEINNRGNGGKL